MKIYLRTELDSSYTNRDNYDLLTNISNLDKQIRKIIINLPYFAEEKLIKEEKEDILCKAEWLQKWYDDYLINLFTDLRVKAIIAKNPDEVFDVVNGYLELLDIIIREDTEAYFKYDELFETIRNLPYNVIDLFDLPKIVIKEPLNKNKVTSYFQQNNNKWGVAV